MAPETMRRCVCVCVWDAQTRETRGKGPPCNRDTAPTPKRNLNFPDTEIDFFEKQAIDVLQREFLIWNSARSVRGRSCTFPGLEAEEVIEIWLLSPAEMWHFAPCHGAGVALPAIIYCEYVKLHFVHISDIKWPSLPPAAPSSSPPRSTSWCCAGHVLEVFSGCLTWPEPKYSPCRHLVLSTKNSPTITPALSYPRWQSSYLWSERHVWVRGAETLQAK